ncbi:flavodoxin family protein [uncultured Acidaminococcus sp.]|uniref:flavodoxin family protein n=1 Tax=uncultured Acidaminococcus sp. TaxID=352152 RepID=UPI00265F7F62|nr:flavodoxin family protein [uncultured Acidaminococcus sp.]
MKTIVLYSSRTGNTRKVAETIAAALPGSGKRRPVRPSLVRSQVPGIWLPSAADH